MARGGAQRGEDGRATRREQARRLLIASFIREDAEEARDGLKVACSSSRTVLQAAAHDAIATEPAQQFVVITCDGARPVRIERRVVDGFGCAAITAGFENRGASFQKVRKVRCKLRLK